MPQPAVLENLQTKKKGGGSSPFYFVAVAGGTGSGKTFVAKELQKVSPAKIALISHDNYYKDRSDVPLEKRKDLNYDEPAALDNDLFLAHLKAWKRGETVAMPQYDFATHTRRPATRPVPPLPVMLFDGILILLPEIAAMFDLKIFVDVEPDIRMARRLLRDVGERDRTFEESLNQYLTSAQPMHEKYIEPGKEVADLIINNNGTLEELQKHLEAPKAQIQKILGEC